MAERAVDSSEIQVGFFVAIFTIFFVNKLLECLRKSPSEITDILPFFSLQQTIHNFFLVISFIADCIVLFAETNGISFFLPIISPTNIKDEANVPDG